MGFMSAFHKKPTPDCVLSVERFSALLSRYLHAMPRNASLRERSITLIARSPAMAAARALALHAADIQAQQLTVQVIFAKLTPLDLLAELSSALTLVDPLHTASGRVRYIRNPALLDAHEQFVLGASTCWTGDVLRRLEGNRNQLDLIEEGTPGAVRLAELSFNAIWSIAKAVPARALSGAPLSQAYGSVNPALAAAGLLSGERSLPLAQAAPVFTRH